MDKNIHNLNRAGYVVYTRKGRIIIEGPDMTIIGQSNNTLWTAEGVLCSECYGFASQDEYIVLDIGLNIGIASLYFANNPKVAHVYGFEPFPETFMQAQVNLTNNPALAAKVTPFNFGLGTENKEVAVHYNKDLPGSMSTIHDRFAEGELQQVSIKSVSEVLEPIFNRHAEKVLCKMDCEGAELEILPALEASGLLRRIDALIMEWHYARPTALVDILERNGFTVFYDHVAMNALGFVRAVRL